MSQAVSAPSTGDNLFAPGMSPGNSAANFPCVVVPLPIRRRLRSDVPPFDPTDPAHIAAWEQLYDFGRQFGEYGA